MVPGLHRERAKGDAPTIRDPRRPRAIKVSRDYSRGSPPHEPKSFNSDMFLALHFFKQTFGSSSQSEITVMAGMMMLI